MTMTWHNIGVESILLVRVQSGLAAETTFTTCDRTMKIGEMNLSFGSFVLFDDDAEKKHRRRQIHCGNQFLLLSFGSRKL
jgi:hypothetical protein